MSEQKTELEQAKDTIQELLRDAQAKDIEIQMLSRSKAGVQLERDKLKDRNKVLEENAKSDATIRRALLLLIGVMKHDVAHLHRLGSDDTLPSEQFTAEALQVLDKIQGAFQLADLPLAQPEPKHEAETTGVVAKIVEPEQKAG